MDTIRTENILRFSCVESHLASGPFCLSSSINSSKSLRPSWNEETSWKHHDLGCSSSTNRKQQDTKRSPFKPHFPLQVGGEKIPKHDPSLYFGVLMLIQELHGSGTLALSHPHQTLVMLEHLLEVKLQVFTSIFEARKLAHAPTATIKWQYDINYYYYLYIMYLYMISILWYNPNRAKHQGNLTPSTLEN